MKVLIIEDEKPSARRLNRMLVNYKMDVVALLHSVEESIEWFKHNEQPDLIFLDIQLSDGLSFEIFEGFKIQSSIIFTTAYDEYALKAFKLNTVDYLLKPIDEDELKVAVEKFKSTQPLKEGLQVDINEIRRLLINPIDRTYKKRFTIKIGQHLKIIAVNNIECLYSENRTTYVFSEGRSYPIDGSLEHWKEQLNPEYFFSVNRTYIIHLKAIKDIISYTNSRLQIKLTTFNEKEIIVSRERVNEFKKWIA